MNVDFTTRLQLTAILFFATYCAAALTMAQGVCK
jgi:hypothetical protein